MGIRTKGIIVPFKLKTKEVQRFLLQLDQSKADDGIIYMKNGWSYTPDAAEKYVSKNKITLYCDVLEKNNLKLFVVNEAKFSNIGHKDLCIFSVNEFELKKLCEDFKFKASIKNNEIVIQTM